MLLEQPHLERLKEQVHMARPGGLPCYVVPKPGFRKAHALLAVRFGAVDQEFELEGERVRVPPGMAHFLEHKLFEDPEGDALQTLSALGASCNAFTSHTSTAYLVSATERFGEALRMLLRFVARPHFTAEGVEREQAIIGQEIGMYQDSPDWVATHQLIANLFVSHPLRHDISGTLESIEQVTPELLHLCYRAFYHLDNLCLVVVGDLAPDTLFGHLEEWVTESGFAPPVEVVRHLPPEPLETTCQRAEIQLPLPRPRVLIGHKDPRPGPGGLALLQKDLALGQGLGLAFGRATDFFQAQFDAGALNHTFSVAATLGESFGFTLCAGEVEEPERLRQAFFDQIEQVLHRGFRPEDVARGRRKAMGRFIRNLDSMGFLASSLVSGHFLEAGILNTLALLEDLTADQVLEALGTFFRPGYHTTLVAQPQSSDG